MLLGRALARRSFEVTFCRLLLPLRRTFGSLGIRELILFFFDCMIDVCAERVLQYLMASDDLHQHTCVSLSLSVGAPHDSIECSDVLVARDSLSGCLPC